MDLASPKVMGILNVTPDSFYAFSRTEGEREIEERVKRIVEEGADIIDVGGCSTRPGYVSPSPDDEWQRVDLACSIIKKSWPEMPLSLDTFRAEIASRAIDRWGVDIINDVSGGADPGMWPLVARKRVAYVLTHNRLDGSKDYEDVTANVITELSWKLNELHRLGVNDVILDPGFGFAKTTEQNFRLLSELQEVARMGYPLLAGISRKSMIYKTLGKNPEETLAGTIALDAIALEKGAKILRVHDVAEARDTVILFQKMKEEG
ncbi:MAG: dihydropteroate synthase [Muribaculaceae bacterium]|nr:dihydropteroate synthase [Muribaculaceae bacterium]